MRVDSLIKLRAMVRIWRRQRASARDPLPGDLMARARRAAMVHGRGAVIRATGIQHRHLTEKVASKVQEAEVRKPRIADVSGERVKVINAAPFYSRIEFPVAPTRPLAEAETRSGFKVRVFAITPETIGLLSVLSRLGRAL